MHLIIDELTRDQKETIKHIINSFKLWAEKDNFIDFNSYVVRLEQRIEICDNEAHFALLFQK